MTEERPAYWSVLPASVRYSPCITDGAKLLYSEISALCNKEGYCWASNDYFADLYQKDKRTIIRWIREMEKQGFIKCEVAKTEKNTSRRRIYLVDQDAPLLQSAT